MYSTARIYGSQLTEQLTLSDPLLNFHNSLFHSHSPTPLAEKVSNSVRTPSDFDHEGKTDCRAF